MKSGGVAGGDVEAAPKDIERRLAEPSVTLSSFIVSNTPSHVMRLLWAVEKPAMDFAQHPLPG